VPVLGWIVVAPVTSTVRAIPTEIPLGPPEGLAIDSAASFDNLQPIGRTNLAERAGALGPRRVEVCRKPAALADC